MPFYEYRCADCGAWDQRLGGLDDHTALCSRCRGMMMRVTEDIYQGYFAQGSYESEKAQNQ